MGIDERISRYLHEDHKSQENRMPYDQGDLVRVRVTRIVDYGAFVVTMDEFLFPGLIHHSQIPNGFQLELNQILDAKIKHIKDGNKLELSLHDLEEEEHPFAQLENLKSHLPKQERTKIDGEMEEITRFLAKEFGVVSEASKEQLEQTVKELGVFRFTMAMMKTLPKFERDLLLHFLKEVKQVGDHL